ncbi:hypothetical protein [Archangium violaceum]|uniref:hypothetical protein n=1 Tax=Archangium violaceum TaxID=83451 RepID=UPI0037BF267A
MMRGSGEATRGGWMLALVCAVLLGACRDPARASGTALYVTTEFDPTLLLTQVRVWGSVEGDGSTFGPDLLPEQPDRLLYSGETLRVLLGDIANGTQAQVSIEGLRNGVVVARGQGSAQIRDGYEVDVTLRLEPATPDNPDGGTFCVGCDGCCRQGVCLDRTFQTCGAGGIACVTCDEARADTCDSRGVCVCGKNPACSGVGVDRCANGQCRCGNGPACAAGQECVNGTCLCTSNSCSGCCLNNTCQQGNTQSACGKGGDVCLQCRKNCNTDRTCK